MNFHLIFFMKLIVFLKSPSIYIFMYYHYIVLCSYYHWIVSKVSICFYNGHNFNYIQYFYHQHDIHVWWIEIFGVKDTEHYLISRQVLAGKFESSSWAGHVKWHTNIIDVFPFFSQFLGLWYVMQQTDTTSSCLTMNYTRVSPTQLRAAKSRQLLVLDSLSIEHTNSYTAKLDIPDFDIAAAMRVKWPLSRYWAGRVLQGGAGYCF